MTRQCRPAFSRSWPSSPQNSPPSPSNARPSKPRLLHRRAQALARFRNPSREPGGWCWTAPSAGWSRARVRMAATGLRPPSTPLHGASAPRGRAPTTAQRAPARKAAAEPSPADLQGACSIEVRTDGCSGGPAESAGAAAEAAAPAGPARGAGRTVPGALDCKTTAPAPDAGTAARSATKRPLPASQPHMEQGSGVNPSSATGCRHVRPTATSGTRNQQGKQTCERTQPWAAPEPRAGSPERASSWPRPGPAASEVRAEPQPNTVPEPRAGSRARASSWPHPGAAASEVCTDSKPRASPEPRAGSQAPASS